MTTGKSVSRTPADLSGKMILLTGGGDGIGRECALAYAREGATVAILDRDLDTARQTASDAGGDSLAFHVDVSDGEAIRVARPYAIDVCSGIEKVPGRKDPVRMRDFMRAVRSTAQRKAAS